MKKLFSFILVVFLTISAPQIVRASTPLPSNLIAYNSTTGEKLLKRSVSHSFFELSMQFLTQRNQAYCGVASITMVLNALGVKGPNDPVYSPYHPITQDNFFTPAMKKILDQDRVFHHGMTLDQASDAAAQFGVKSTAIHSNTLTQNKMRKILISVLKNKHKYAVVNFFRPGLKENGGGHFSPIAAYDYRSDRFLILDVARYKYPPIWVKTEDLWNGINTVDTASQKKRGILLLKTQSL
ncbi:MAG: hypothetical protein A3F11_01325 [Gammaproteobacteria bacterium RIFCSPHIGHO2_12_FULL_37_14]|nr:MAG: hypothetical protein A3F11_01325 [Gammaproteobacteria bacterium RIFCSPHIGHO2_12_FULL_37_14]